MKKYRVNGKVYRVGDHVTPEMLKEHLAPKPEKLMEPGIYTDGDRFMMVGEDGEPRDVNIKDDLVWLS